MKKSVYVSEPIKALMDLFGSEDNSVRGFSSMVNAAVGRYLDICERYRPQLSTQEWCLIADALNGCWMNESFASNYLILEVSDHIRLNGADQKWDVDGVALVNKLQGMDYATLTSIVHAVEIFWSRTDELTSGVTSKELWSPIVGERCICESPKGE